MRYISLYLKYEDGHDSVLPKVQKLYNIYVIYVLLNKFRKVYNLFTFLLWKRT